jgi:hypothetical protein
MAIIRTNKEKDQYARISRHLLQDSTLTWEARGFASYLFSKHTNWEINVEALTKESPAGRTRVYRILKELIGAGYLIREPYRENGKIQYLYTLYESKELAQKHTPLDTEPVPVSDSSDLIQVSDSGNQSQLSDSENLHWSCKEEKTKEQQTKEQTKKQTKEKKTTEANESVVVVCDFSEEQVFAYAQAEANIKNPFGFTKSVLDGTAKDMPRILQSIGEWLVLRPPRTTTPLPLPGEPVPDLLEEFLSLLRKSKVNPTSFLTWFKPIEAMSRGDTTVYFQVPEAKYRDWITQYYPDIVTEALEAIGLAGYQFEFVVSNSS